MPQKKSNNTKKLPNAPLTEVVFELRWGLKGGQDIPAAFWSDPGYTVLADNFASEADKQGLVYIQNMSQGKQLAAHSIGLRFSKSENDLFPMWQIGPGIFAANHSAAYDWTAYKKLILDGSKALFSSYPKMKTFSLKPAYLELRYIDSFDSRYTTNYDVAKFINEKTSMDIVFPAAFGDLPIKKLSSSLLQFEFPVSNMKDTVFCIKIGNAKKDETDIIVLESKVLTSSKSISIGESAQKRKSFLNNWLTGAHEITSPFFKSFVCDSLMNQFKGNVTQ